jgi:hypothetical protein
MPVTMSPQAVTPALWTYTYLQAPINGQGYTYFNIPATFTDLGTISAGGTATCNVGANGVFRMIAGGNMTVAFSNITSGAGKASFWQVEIKGGGNYTVTWPAAVKWDGGGAANVAPLLSTNTTLLNFYTRDAGTTIYGGYAFADMYV